MQKKKYIERDKQFIKMLSNGSTCKDIALKYKLSVETVLSKLKWLKLKHGCKSQSELVAKFLREKIIE